VRQAKLGYIFAQKQMRATALVSKNEGCRYKVTELLRDFALVLWGKSTGKE